MIDSHSACSTLHSPPNLVYGARLLVPFLQSSFIEAAVYVRLDVVIHKCVTNRKRASSQGLQTFVYIDMLPTSCQYV